MTRDGVIYAPRRYLQGRESTLRAPSNNREEGRGVEGRGVIVREGDVKIERSLRIKIGTVTHQVGVAECL